MLSKELISIMLEKFKDLSDAEFSKKLDQFSKIRSCVKLRNQRIEDLMLDYQFKLSQLQKEVICNHEITKKYSDPSGGSDRCIECLVCGRTL